MISPGTTSSVGSAAARARVGPALETAVGFGASAHAAKGDERAAAAELAADPDVAFAEPNYIRHVDAVDSRLWAFYNPGGLNMQYTSGGTGYIPSTYASSFGSGCALSTYDAPSITL